MAGDRRERRPRAHPDGSGFAASLEGARARAIGVASTGPDGVPDALARYELSRLDGARRLVMSGQQFIRSFAFEPQQSS